jgi:hypothetical protein
MWLPVLRYEDGYGFTYGARVSFVDVLGKRSRLSVPLTWGGERRATVELERGFEKGPLSRILATGGVWRREHPSLDVGDRREGGTILADRAMRSWFRIGGTASAASVHFGDTSDTLSTAGIEATVDTRRDPAFPRNAIFASAQWERLWFDHAQDTSRLQADVRGFIGLFGSSVLALRLQQSRAADPLPAFQQALLGGTSSLRGPSVGWDARAQDADFVAAKHRSRRHRDFRRHRRRLRRAHDPGSREVRHRHRRRLVPATARAVVSPRRRPRPRPRHPRPRHARRDVLK